MAAIKLVVFDIAGTIIEDQGEVVAAFSHALRKNAIPFKEGELKARMGAAKREVIRHFVEQQVAPKHVRDKKVEATYSSFRTELQMLYSEGIVPIENAATTFAWCQEHGIQIATTTGFDGEISKMILETLGWQDRFAANISSGDVGQGRPAPFMIFRAMEATGVQNVKEVINVGDTPLDLQAGGNAGVRGVVGVLTGTHDEPRLQREPHTHIISSVADLPALIEREYSSRTSYFPRKSSTA